MILHDRYPNNVCMPHRLFVPNPSGTCLWHVRRAPSHKIHNQSLICWSIFDKWIWIIFFEFRSYPVFSILLLGFMFYFFHINQWSQSLSPTRHTHTSSGSVILLNCIYNNANHLTYASTQPHSGVYYMFYSWNCIVFVCQEPCTVDHTIWFCSILLTF